MIVCPNCKEEIDDDSHFCDQCGQQLAYCERCGRVGLGRRCTQCGGLMLSREEYEHKAAQPVDLSQSASVDITNQPGGALPGGNQTGTFRSIPQLMLHNDTVGLRLIAINGAVIGRRQGPYANQLQQHRYVSGLHAQLKYNPATGWLVADKHSSNGTKLNGHPLQPDVEMTLKTGDILTIANIPLQVTITWTEEGGTN